MKKIFYTPGPSQVYPSLEAHLAAALVDQVPSMSHRSQAFMDLYAETVTALRLLLGIPEDYEVFFMSSASECWERIAQNCIVDHSFHFVNGSFSKRFFETVKAYGKSPIIHEVEFGEGFDIAGTDIPDEVELIAAIANETSSGVWTPPKEIEKLRERYPNKLLVVDAVSALPAYPIDISKLDSIYFSVQKGFGMPAGLGVLVLSPGMLAKSAMLRAEGKITGSYHSFESMLAKAEKNQTPETPNVLSIYLLGKLSEDMLAKGKGLEDEIFERAALLYDYFGVHPDLEPFVKDHSQRSPYVIVVNTKPAEAPRWIEALAEQGFVIGSGYGARKNDQLRIANFPATSRKDLEDLLAAFKAVKP